MDGEIVGAGGSQGLIDGQRLGIAANGETAVGEYQAAGTVARRQPGIGGG